MSFPVTRLKRLRVSSGLRDLVRENKLSIQDLIIPLFVIHGENLKKPIEAMPGQNQYSVDRLVGQAEYLYQSGIRAVLLFGLPAQKDELGSESYSQHGIVQQAIRAIKNKTPDLIIMTDVCLCSYTLSGHCGVLQETQNQARINNDVTCELLGKIAVSHAEAGADLVAPSAMTDGMIQAMRMALDQAEFLEIGLLSYAVKYASSFYGPFRQAADSAPQKGDRKTYQMDPANAREALREAEEDLSEGADILMVKPGLAYLDIIYRLREKFDCPIAAYHVSGEYAMVKAAEEKGWVDGPRVLYESLLSIKRAGADMIITYAFEDIKNFLE